MNTLSKSIMRGASVYQSTERHATGDVYKRQGLDNPEWLSLKCKTEYALELRENHSGIEGAYHFNKKYWNQVSLQGDIDDKLILSLIDHSYDCLLYTSFVPQFFTNCFTQGIGFATSKIRQQT